MPEQKFEITEEFIDQRLDIFLTSMLGLPRSQVQKLIKSGLVTLAGESPSVHHWLKKGELVVVKNRPPAKMQEASALALNIIRETDNYIVVLKPAGLLVHPTDSSSSVTLTQSLLRHDPSIAAVGAHGRPGIVHRLDRDVGGLLVVAKTQKMYEELQRQFKERLVKKKYTALVEGVIPQAEGVLDFVMARSKTYPGRMAARPKGQDGRAAETRYTVLQKFSHHTLLELELVTGRTHQIRAHLKAFRHPIVGDKFYSTKKKKNNKVVSDLARPFLQATALGFSDLLGQWQEFKAPLDSELDNYLNTIS